MIYKTEAITIMDNKERDLEFTFRILSTIIL